MNGNKSGVKVFVFVCECVRERLKKCNGEEDKDKNKNKDQNKDKHQDKEKDKDIDQGKDMEANKQEKHSPLPKAYPFLSSSNLWPPRSSSHHSALPQAEQSSPQAPVPLMKYLRFSASEQRLVASEGCWTGCHRLLRLLWHLLPATVRQRGIPI